MTTTDVRDDPMAPSAGSAPACIGDVRVNGELRSCPGVPTWLAVTTCRAGDDRDGPVCSQHAERLVRGSVDVDGHAVDVFSLVRIGGAR